MADLGSGAVLVVGQDPEENSDAAGTIALIRDLLVLLARQFSRALLDGPLDIVGGHVGRTRGLRGSFQPQVALGVSSPVSRRHRDLAEDLGKELPPLHV